MLGIVGIVVILVMVFGAYAWPGGKWVSSSRPCRTR